MLDPDIAAVSPSSVWRVLHRAGLPRKWNSKKSKKGTGFQQPPKPRRGAGKCSSRHGFYSFPAPLPRFPPRVLPDSFSLGDLPTALRGLACPI